MPNPPSYPVWTDDRVARWLARAPALERQLEPVSDVLFAAAALRPGERVLDVGCGTGPTTRRAARAVGPTGRVVGLDLAPEMLDAAAAATPEREDAAAIEWEAADVVTWQPPPAAFDVVLSRFGVMFFSDPSAAFGRLAAATRPGGRLAMATWSRRDRSDVFAVPFHAAIAELRRRGTPVEVPPDDEGPFSLHDPAAVGELLTAAGWTGARTAEHDLVLALAGGTDPRSATEAILGSGPLIAITAGLSDADRAAVADAISAVLAHHVDAAGHVHLTGHINLTTAHRRIPVATPESP